jgi:hypothetical protein
MELKNFRIKVAGRSFVGAYLSGGLAVLLAQCFYRVPTVSAIRVSL